MTAAVATDLRGLCLGLARDARAAGRQLAAATRASKDAWLRHAADDLERLAHVVLEANNRDLLAAPDFGLSAAQVDRLRLTPARVAGMAEGLRQVAALPDPVGEVLGGGTRPNGLQIVKVGVPLGVIFFLYESRPNVTADAAALCVKSGNAVILRGGKEAAHSNAAVLEVLTESLPNFGLPADAVRAVPTADRAAVGELLRLNEYIDLAIPRGGESLIRRVVQEARMPVLKHYLGNCHVYVDRAADADMAENILVNSKCQRPGVCNAAESLLIDRAVAPALLPRLAAALVERGVELRGCDESRALVPGMGAATEQDFAAEFADLILSVKVVDGVAAAVEHVNRYGSGHTDAIVTGDLAASRAFTAGVDSAVVLVNASTRFNDGFEMGMGAEIGISTDKLHARGPCGLRELTTYKYVVHGDGHVRS